MPRLRAPFALDGAQVRVVTVDGEPWFVTRDLCAILGIADSGNALAGLEENEKGIRTVDTLGDPKKSGYVMNLASMR